MMMSQWLRRLIKSHASILRAQSVENSRPLPRRRLAVGLETLEPRLVFSVFVVNSLADGTLASLQGNGTLDLREAIELATHLNKSVDGHVNAASTPGRFTGVDPALVNTIRFDASLDGQTINLLGAGDGSVGPSAFGINNNAQLTIDGETGITKGITIARPKTFTIAASGLPAPATFNTPAFRLAAINPNSALTLKGLTVRGFIAQGFKGGGGDVQATGGGSAGMGGVIFNRGDLTIVDSTLADNLAQGGAGGSFRYIYHTLLNGHLDRSDSLSGSGGAGLGGDGADSTFEDGDGGAGGGPNGGVGGTRLYPDGRSGTDFGGGGGGAFGSVIVGDFGNAGSGNFGGGGGGGSSGDSFFWDSGTNGGNGGLGGGGGGGVLVGQPHGGLAGNGGLGGGDAAGSLGGGGAGMGGAIFNWGGTVTITNSTLTGNAARGGAGGTTEAGAQHGNAGGGSGGAILGFNGTVTITDSTISKNTADAGARGVFILGYNAAATGAISNTIIGESNTSPGEYDLVFGALNGTATVGGRSNLISSLFAESGTTTNNLVGTVAGDPKLGALQDNGGRTPTMAILAGSAALDAGSNAAVAAGVSTDQRGDLRIRNGTVDIGAFESRTQQTISFGNLAGRTYGDADFAISATSSSLLPVGFTASGDASVYQSGGVWYVHIIGAGSATITANQAGNADYESAPLVAQTLSIAKTASVTTSVGAGPLTYNGSAQVGGSGTVTGAGGLNTSATSLTYSANSDGTGAADFTNAGTYYVTAHYAGDTNHLASDGAAVAIVIKKADATVTVAGYSGVYDRVYHGATGSATGVGGTSVGTLNLGAAFINVPGGMAHWTFDGGRNYLSKQGDVAIQILAKHITATFTAASKVYDGKTSATVTSRSLIGVISPDAVSLTGGTATFASKNVGTWTVSLNGATLSGAAAWNYVLDSVATTTASITPKPLTGTAETQSALNVASNGNVEFKISVTQSGIVDGQSVAQLFDDASFALTVGGRTYSVRPQASVKGGFVMVSFRMTDELKAILAANTTATNGGNAQTVALNLSATSKDGNYTLSVTALTKLFNTSK